MDHYEFCPKCNGLRKVSISISIKKVVGSYGETNEVLAFAYHCETCLSFIGSVEKEEAEALGYNRFPAYLP